MFSEGIASLLPSFCGSIAGYLYVTNVRGVQSWRLPAAVERALSLFNGSPPTPGNFRGARARNPSRRAGGAGGAGLGSSGGGGGFAPPAAPPSEENIAQLMSMGFDRPAVEAALRSAENNVQIAADRLLASS
jgi:hypothetical protein